jgi:hypothetical protein
MLSSDPLPLTHSLTLTHSFTNESEAQLKNTIALSCFIATSTMSSSRFQEMSLAVVTPTGRPSSSLAPQCSPRPPSVITNPASRKSCPSLKESLRDVAGTINMFKEEQRSRANSITVNDPSKLLFFEPPFTPPPFVLSEDPLQDSAQSQPWGNTASHPLTGGPPVFQLPPPLPGRGPQGVFSSVKAAFLSGHGKKAEGRGKEKARLSRMETIKEDHPCKGPPGFGNMFNASAFNKHWKRGKKESSDRKPIATAQSEMFLSAVDPSCNPETSTHTDPMPAMVRISFKTSAGIVEKTCWTSLNAVDTWEACNCS